MTLSLRSSEEDLIQRLQDGVHSLLIMKRTHGERLHDTGMRFRTEIRISIRYKYRRTRNQVNRQKRTMGTTAKRFKKAVPVSWKPSVRFKVQKVVTLPHMLFKQDLY